MEDKEIAAPEELEPSAESGETPPAEDRIAAVANQSTPEVETPVIAPEAADQPGGEEAGVPEPPFDEAEPQEESRFRKFIRKLLRWTLGLLIVFGIGMIAGIQFFYRPANQEIQRLNQDLLAAQGQIASLEQEISDLEARIASLQALEDTNNELLAEQKKLDLHIALLDARLDTANALLALSAEDLAQARIILTRTSDTLQKISDLLEPNQRQTVSAMQNRLELVLDELDSDIYAAQSDLDVLAASLLQMEDALFSE